jgi:hypothetical protein
LRFLQVYPVPAVPPVLQPIFLCRVPLTS